jgi:hypothetical protein
VAAGSAVSRGSLADLYANADDLPCADFGLLGPLKRSPEYAGIRKRVADLKPVDAWQVNMLHYFVFQLRPSDEAPADAVTPFALFTMRWEDNEPVSAIVVTPSPSGDHAEVTNLREPKSTHTVPLGPNEASARSESSG